MRSSRPPRSGKEAGGSIGGTGCMRARVSRFLHRQHLAANAIPSLDQRPEPTSLTDNMNNKERTNRSSSEQRPAPATEPGVIEVRRISIRRRTHEVALRLLEESRA